MANAPRRFTLRRRIARVLAIVTVLLCGFSPVAYAASVYGVVRGPDGKLVPSGTFVVLGAKGEVLKTVTTDGSGRYSVFLKPGIYRARLGTAWEATVQSLSEPSQQDIQFQAVQ